jgi:hypothetical protein
MPDLKSLGWLSGEWFYLLIVEEPIKTALQPRANRSECRVGMPRAHSPRASAVTLITPTAWTSKLPFAGRLVPPTRTFDKGVYRWYRYYRGSGAHDPALLSRKSRARARALASVVTDVLGSPSM